MSDVLIKNMKMPTSCAKCLFRDGIFCMAVNGKRISYSGLEIKEYFCPLVPVPPHGRLIDADALWSEINKICDGYEAGIITDLTCINQILSAVRHAPTIIEANDNAFNALGALDGGRK